MPHNQSFPSFFVMTGRRKTDRAVMESDDWLLGKRGNQQSALAVISRLWTNEHLKNLQSGMPASATHVFVPVPSTTFTNTIPEMMARCLARSLAGKLACRWLDSHSFCSMTAQVAMKEVAKMDRPFAPRGYFVSNMAIRKELAGKEVTVVEDVLTTGASAFQFVKMLCHEGIHVRAVVGLMGSPVLRCSPPLKNALRRALRTAGLELRSTEISAECSAGEVEALIRLVLTLRTPQEKELFVSRMKKTLAARRPTSRPDQSGR